MVSVIKQQLMTGRRENQGVSDYVCMSAVHFTRQTPSDSLIRLFSATGSPEIFTSAVLVYTSTASVEKMTGHLAFNRDKMQF